MDHISKVHPGFDPPALGVLITADQRADKLESAVVELERKKITREEGQKASRAMEALNVNQTQLKPEDVDLIVSHFLSHPPRTVPFGDCSVWKKGIKDENSNLGC